MDAGTPPTVRDSLVGIWAVNAGGMQSQVVLSPDGKYSNTLVGGAQGHSGTWAVADNPNGGHTLTFTLTGSFPQTYVGPLGSTPIIWPKSELWYVTGIQPDRIDIYGGVMSRLQPGQEMGAGGMGWPGMSPQQYMGGMVDYDAEMAKEMKQIGDAGRKTAGFLKQVWSGFKKR